MKEQSEAFKNNMKVAVVGGGISGLSAALILSQKYNVHLLEADNRLGGHAHTVVVEEKNLNVPLDTGFLVYNNLTYPHLTKFFDYLSVPTVDSDMTLSIRSDDGIEWAGTNLNTVFAQRKNVFRLRYLQMLKDILKFHQQVEENLKFATENKWTLQDLVNYRKLSDSFLTWYLLPMTGAIWSMPFSEALQFPAETFLTFCKNHRLLQVNQRPVWKTVAGGSIEYVRRVRARLKNIHLNSPVIGIEKHDEKVLLWVKDKPTLFDKVVLATHAPISRSLVANYAPEVANYLDVFSTNPNRVTLHRDDGVMPRNRSCWSSWNVRSSGKVKDKNGISLSYHCNRLQPVQSATNYFLTLNESQDFSGTQGHFFYDHPRMDRATIERQKDLDQIQGYKGIYLAGAWTRYGFHEDGILSAVNISRKLGCEPQWISS